MTAAARRHQKKTLASCQGLSTQHNITEGIILRHWVTMINTVALKLRFKGLTHGCDRPHVLRPAAALLTAHEPATETVTKQLQRSAPGKYADLIAKCFAHSRSRRGCEAKVAGATFVLGVAAIACRFCPMFDLRRRQRCNVMKRSFRIERFAGHVLYTSITRRA